MNDSPQTAKPEMHVTTELQRRGMRAAIGTQVFSASGNTIYDSGLLLLYLTKHGFSDRVIILLIASKTLLMMLLSIPAAQWCDRIGIKPVSIVGIFIGFAGFLGITFGASLPEPWNLRVIVVSVITFSSGIVIFNAGWYALLKGIVPQEVTGRFFGFLRFSSQFVALLCVIGYSLFLQSDSAIWLFQAVFLVILAGQAAKLFFFLRIPAFDQPTSKSHTLLASVKAVLPSPQFMPFCAYCFMLALFTVAMPTLFNLAEKKHLNLGDNTIAMLGGVIMTGTVAGYFMGGLIVDRIGTRAVFLFCHIGFMVVACLFPLRDVFGLPTVAYFIGLHLCWGILAASSTIAVSTELFAVLPAHHRSLATSIWWSLSGGGGAMSGLLAAGAVSLGFLQKEWTLFGHIVSQYDALILIYGLMTGLMAVTLGLVPSVIGKSQWMPRSST